MVRNKLFRVKNLNLPEFCIRRWDNQVAKIVINETLFMKRHTKLQLRAGTEAVMNLARKTSLHEWCKMGPNVVVTFNIQMDDEKVDQKD